MAKSKLPKKMNKQGKKKKRARDGRPNALVGAAHDYMRLLADPCAAPMARSPFAGIGSAYMVRTVNSLRLPAATGTVLDWVVEVTPGSFPYGVNYGTAVSGTAITLTQPQTNCWVTATPSVRTYRPVAACLKFVSTSAIATRSGLIGRSYSPCPMISTTSTVVASTVMSHTLSQESNGSVAHEVRWLPSVKDQEFQGIIQAGLLQRDSRGSMQLTGVAVDGNAGNVGGYLEVTIVWEWEPEMDVIDGVTPSFAAPGNTSLNQVLTAIGDVGAFAIRAAGDLGVRAAYSYASGSFMRKSPSLLTSR